MPRASACNSASCTRTAGSPRRTAARPVTSDALDPADHREMRVPQHFLRHAHGGAGCAPVEQHPGQPPLHVTGPRVQVTLGAVGQPGAEGLLGVGEHACAGLQGAHVGPRPRGVLLQSIGQGDVERLVEPRPAGDQVAPAPQRGTDVDQRVRLDLAVTRRARLVKGPLTPGEHLPRGAAEHP